MTGKGPLETPAEQKRGILSSFVNYLRNFGSEFLTSIFIGWAVELVFCLYSQSGYGSALRAFAIIWFASGAAFFVGTMAGFLFGFPKASAASLPLLEGYGDNTNLEEVSDWLTKIIVGIGLVDFGKIRAFIWQVGDSVAQSIDLPGQLTSRPIAIAAMIYGFVCGFLFFYVWARLRFFDELKRRADIAKARMPQS